MQRAGVPVAFGTGGGTSSAIVAVRKWFTAQRCARGLLDRVGPVRPQRMDSPPLRHNECGEALYSRALIVDTKTSICTVAAESRSAIAGIRERAVHSRTSLPM